MILAVLDTNVVLSGLVGFSRPDSPPGAILRAWRARRFELVISRPILDELERVLRRPYFRGRISEDDVDAARRLFEEEALVVLSGDRVVGLATHPADDLIVSTALAAAADYLVTGDRAFRESAGAISRPTVLSPREFLTVLGD